MKESNLAFNYDLNFKDLIQNFAKDWSIEITPAGSKKVDSFSNILVEGKTVNVTFLPNSNPNDTIDLCERLFNEGMNPVPHIVARSVTDNEHLDKYLGQLKKRAKISEILVIAGSAARPAGEFFETMQILNSGLIQKYGISKIGVAGHPEGNADITEKSLEDSLLAKYIWSKKEGISMYIETQFCFDCFPVIEWEKKLYVSGVDLPIHIGIPGPAKIKTLLRFAHSSGIGPSMRFIVKQAKNLTKLLMTQAPDKFIFGLSKNNYFKNNSLIKKIHYYPFGGFENTVSWANSLENGNFKIINEDSFIIE